MALVVFAGQSNTGGMNMNASTLTRPWSPDPLTLIWDARNHAWTPMQPGTNTGYGPQPETWGPEVAFALQFRAMYPNEVLRIVKVAHGGSRLAIDGRDWVYDWSPDSRNEIFDEVTATVAEARAAAGAPRVDAVFFGQGEEDANNLATAQAYGANLQALFQAIRTHWLSDAAGKIGFFQINATSPYAHEVRAAQASVDAADVHAVSFDTEPFPRQPDLLHFSAAGYDLIGEAYARLLADWRGAAAPGGQVLTGTDGADTLMGGAGDDQIAGGAGADFLRGGDGADQMSGGLGFDDMHGNLGADTLAGGGDGDWVVGGQHDDRLFGEDGDDVVLGNLGNDFVDGGAGGDVLRGGQGDDLIHGWDGNDWISGDRGNDTISGGAGADIFNVFGDSGLDRVTDFNALAGDRVKVEPGYAYSAAQSGADVVVTVGSAQVVLAGVQLSSLPDGWIYVG